MINEGKLSLAEAVYITTFIITTKVFFTSLSLLVKITGTAAWYTTLISCATSMVFFLFIYLLMKRFHGKNIIQIFEIVLGKYIGKVLSVLFVVYWIYYSGLNIREFMEMIKSYNLPYTPPSIIVFMFISVVCLISYFGLNGVSRIATLSFYPILIAFVIILILASPNYDIDYLKPYLGYGIGQSIKIGLLRSSAYEEVFILAVIINSINNIKDFKRAGLLSLLISGALISASFLCYLMCFDYIVGSEHLSGLFQLSRITYFNRYFQRLESIFLLIWVISSVVAVSISFYISISIYCKTFKINNYRPLIIPFAFLLFLITFSSESISEIMDIHIKIIRQYSLFFIYLMPLAALIISLILKKGATKNVKKA